MCYQVKVSDVGGFEEVRFLDAEVYAFAICAVGKCGGIIVR